MTLKKILPTTILAALFVFGAWIIYGTIFPSRHYNPGQPISRIQIVANETPYYHFKGLDQPHYYVIKSQKYPNDFHISDEVLKLVQDNDSIAKSIKDIKYGDTLFVYLDSTSVNKLNNSTRNIEIIGLVKDGNWIINPDNLEKYFRDRKANNRFSLFVVVLIFYFMHRKKRKSESEV